MTNFAKLLIEIGETNLKATNGKINQTVRNEMKAKIVDALVADLAEFEPVKTLDGVAIPVENGKNLVVFTLDPVIKALDFDIDGAGNEFADKVAEREARALELARKKQEKATK